MQLETKLLQDTVSFFHIELYNVFVLNTHIQTKRKTKHFKTYFHMNVFFYFDVRNLLPMVDKLVSKHPVYLNKLS